MVDRPRHAHAVGRPDRERRLSLEAVAALVAASGVGGRRLRQAIARLADGPQCLDDLVRECALPRRTAQALLRAAGPDLEESGPGARLRPGVAGAYRERFGYEQLRRTEPVDPLAVTAGGLTVRLDPLLAGAPAADPALDQVRATPDTVARRALWLDATFDLAGAHLLCVGDHDLTSLGVALANPDCRVTVVDVDERLLDHIAATGLRVECRYADLRFGLPPDLAAGADLVFTDPPYTPAGVALFLARGLRALRDRANGRLVMAYGFSPLTPALGVRVQHAIGELDLAVEAILPAFNRYRGAQAVGSASDLYVCRPTARTWQVLDRRLAAAALNVYTHGARAVESGRADLPEPVASATVDAVPGVDLIVGPGWRRGERTLSLADLFADAPPAGRPRAVAANLLDDPGAWLLRTLLTLNAERLALLVPNRHPDLADATGQAGLRSIVAAKYGLRMRRSFPTPHHAVVEATRVDGAGKLAGWVLTHALGKLGNVLAEGLVHASGGSLTRNQGRQRAAELIPESLLDVRLIDLPRGAIRAVLASLAADA